MAVLTLKYKGKSQASFPIGMGDTFIIGAKRAMTSWSTTWRCRSTTPRSKVHRDEFLLIDLHSENGTFVNEQPHQGALADRRRRRHHRQAHAEFLEPPEPGPPGQNGAGRFIETMQMDTTRFREMLRKNNLPVPREANAKRTVRPGAHLSRRAQDGFSTGAIARSASAKM